VTSLGVGAHLEAWGVPPGRITELDWWEETEVAGLQLVATPARHFSGRGFGASKTFWSGFAVRGPRHSVWFSGDTGPWDEGFAEIGERFGGFDLSMIEIGAWHPSWGTIHLGPENALKVHELVRAKTLMPVHWGTFNLALHAWDQPIAHIQRLAEAANIQLLSPMMGETVHRESGVAEYWRGRR
jgi:L-ascorbate metabolism protein UlaG (beta-lactamase superfamily)